MKKCTKCGQIKDVSEFAKDKKQSSGLKCACFRAYKQAIKNTPKVIPEKKRCCRCKMVKPSSEFYLSAHQKSGLFSACKECENSRISSKKEARSNYWKKYYRERTQELHFLRKYNLTKDQRHQMLDQQDHACAICLKKEFFFPRILAVDHCHTTGAIRGLLCSSCNKAIGLFEDDSARMVRAASYVTSGGVSNKLTAQG